MVAGAFNEGGTVAIQGRDCFLFRRKRWLIRWGLRRRETLHSFLVDGVFRVGKKFIASWGEPPCSRAERLRGSGKDRLLGQKVTRSAEKRFYWNQGLLGRGEVAKRGESGRQWKLGGCLPLLRAAEPVFDF